MASVITRKDIGIPWLRRSEPWQGMSGVRPKDVRADETHQQGKDYWQHSIVYTTMP